MRTLNYFTNLYDFAFVAAALVYLILKYVITSVAILNCCAEWKCKIKYNKWKSTKCFHYLTQTVTKLNTWLVRIIISQSEDISDKAESPPQNPSKITSRDNSPDKKGDGNELKDANEERDDRNAMISFIMEKVEDNIEEVQKTLKTFSRPLYLRNNKIKDYDVNVFGVIVICFGVLVAVSAYSTFLLEQTYVCTEDEEIYCFPRLLNPSDPDNPNLTVAEMQTRVNNCRMWENPSSDSSSKVGYICFTFALKSSEALGKIGGLLALFVLTTKIIISILLNIYEQLKKFRCLLKSLQFTALLILVPLNFSATALLLFLSFRNTGVAIQAGDGQGITRTVISYLMQNSVQILIISGTIELLLLVSWRDYSCEKTFERQDLQEPLQDENTEV